MMHRLIRATLPYAFIAATIVAALLEAVSHV